MKEIADGLKELRQGYIESRYGCDFNCCCMHLGALLRGLHDLKFANEDLSDSPFGDLSLVQVVEKLRTIKHPVWTAVPVSCCRGGNNGYYAYQNSPCPKCPKAHVCSGQVLAFGFQEVQLGVGESVLTSTSQGALAQHAKRLMQTLKGKIDMKLEQFVFGAEAKPACSTS